MDNNRSPGFFKPLRILAIEDNQVDIRIIESMLTESPNNASLFKISTSMKDAMAILEETQFDVIILDLNLPDSQGPDTLKKLNEKYPHLPVVVNTGAYEENLGIQALGSGAQDFLVKGKYTAYILTKTLHYAVERKRLELDLKEVYEKLKAAQTQLIQAEKLKVVGGLASGVAHEVRNPLATILYGATYLSEQLKSKDKKINSVLDNIKEATNRANNIIADLLDFASLSKLSRESHDLNEVTEKSLFLVNHAFEKKKIKVKKNFAKNLPQIKIDKNRIEQVLVNLILNAIQAMPEGGALTVQTYTTTLSKDYSELPNVNRTEFSPGQRIVVCTIEDNGSGIGEEELGKIFDPFFTTKRAKGGVGLGLSVCQNIIEIHEGDIIVENKADQGAQATLVFKA